MSKQKIEFKQDKHCKNVFYSNDKGKYIFCMNISSDELTEINNINLNYLIKKFLIYEDKKDKTRFYNGILIDSKNSRYNEIKRYNNKVFVKDYNKNIKNYCQQYELDIIDENQSNDFIKMISYKLIIGLGDPNIVETSITLHSIYGIPYIPGQAIKGVMRNYFLSSYYDIEKGQFDNDFSEGKYNLKDLYTLIFGDDFKGDNNRKGGIIFFDAFPYSDDEVLIETDFMTPHYGNYYSGNCFPKDDGDPNPIPFYVLKNASFDFPIAIDKKVYNKYKQINNRFIEYNKFKKVVYNLLKKALEESGLGAKTAVGYGHLKSLEKDNEQNFLDKSLQKLREHFNKTQNL